MKKETKKYYDVEVTIYEIPFMEENQGLIKVTGLPSFEEAESILFDREYTPVKERKFSSFVARGASPKVNSYVLAKNINQKQLANILIDIGMVDGMAYEIDTDLVSVKDTVAEMIATVKISADDITGVTLGNPGRITAGTIKMEDIIPEEPKKKRTKKK